MEEIKSILLDFQEISFETGVPRHFLIERVPKKATICIGVRRSGKSTYLFQLIRGLLKSGVSRENILYLNFFDDRLHRLRKEGLGVILEAYYSLYPEKKNTETLHCFFDEIQDIPGWEAFVDRILRTEKCEVTITGSSARLLSKKTATQMRGRSLSWEIFPFSFREFLDYHNVDGAPPLPTKKQLLIRKAFDDYFETGAFPEVLSLKRHLRIKTHQEYFHAILFRDLIERFDVSHPRALADLARRLVDNTASLYSINKLTGYLKSLGHRAPKATVSIWLRWFEDAYFLFTVRIFDSSLARANSNPKKIYCVDHSLVKSVSSGVLLNTGHLFENLVFTALRRAHTDIFYYRTNAGREVDFVVRKRDDTRLLFQACESMANPGTRKREIDALSEAMGELKLTRGTVVTRNDSEQIEVASGTIEVMPAWRFLLSLPESEEQEPEPRQ